MILTNIPKMAYNCALLLRTPVVPRSRATLALFSRARRGALPHLTHDWPGWSFAIPAFFYRAHEATAHDVVQMDERCAQVAAALDHRDPEFHEHDAIALRAQANSLRCFNRGKE